MKIRIEKDVNVHKINQLIAVTDAGQFPIESGAVGDNLAIPVDGSANVVLTDIELSANTVN